MRIGGEAPRRRADSKPRRHSPISGCRCVGRHLQATVNATLGCSNSMATTPPREVAGPAGVSPVVAIRHNTTSSSRAQLSVSTARSAVPYHGRIPRFAPSMRLPQIQRTRRA
jgi:hypothetical protein